MTVLVVLPCWLRVRPHKGMSINELYPDVELDIIMLRNERARDAKSESFQVVSAGPCLASSVTGTM